MRAHPRAAYAGEELVIPERLVVAPATGVFRGDALVGTELERGAQVGILESSGERHPVVSPFSGHIVRIVAHDGDRLRPGEPVAWLRVE